MLYVLFLLFGAANAATNQGILNLFHKKFSGDGTYYGHTETGMCQFNPQGLPPAATNPKIKYQVALNKPQFQNSMACGMCFKVHGSGKGSGHDPITGDFYVFANNLCPECHAGSLDFAVSGDGRWGIEIQAVQCPVGNTKLEYKFQGSNNYYMKLQVRNARIPVTEAQVMQGGHYVSMKHTADGFWVLSNGKPADNNGGIHVKLTAANGDHVTDIIPRLDGHDEAFYLNPLQHPTEKCWYSRQAMGHNTLQKVVPDLCRKAGISGYKTNHSLRRTTATRLFEKGVPEQLIMERTGHRSVEGVRAYKVTSDAQRLEVSSLINRPGQDGEDADVTDQKPTDTLPATRDTSPVEELFKSVISAENCVINVTVIKKE